MTSAEVRALAKERRQMILDREVRISANAPRPISVDPFDADKPYVTTDAIEFVVGGEHKTVPADFHFDGASIPAFAWVLLFALQFLAWLVGFRWLRIVNWCKPLNTFHKNLYAALFHDWAWRTTHYGRITGKRLANAAFEAILVASGVHWVIARAMYYAVSLAGTGTYNRYADANDREE